ncbi:MAG TPA: hypothetical protein VME66_08195 [Candidatus Acidoferrales bacterium]|nr:hypothetical protein [Candidatus Acidoferrales bacterium]
MLLSIHVPKTAGNSFREALLRTFGARVFTDYGDWAGFNLPEVNARRQARETAMRTRRDELLASYDVIHGHFIADKYLGLFPEAEFIAFFRDPYQQAIAHYHFVKRNPQRPHPEARIVQERQMSLTEYLEWDAFHNHQSQFLGSLSIEDLAFVGLSERYEQSLDLFAHTFGHNLGEPFFENVNEGRMTQGYGVGPDERRVIERTRAADIELYRRARERFARQSRRMRISA